MFKRSKGHLSAIELLKSTEQALAEECQLHIQKLKFILMGLPDNWEAESLDETCFVINVNKGRVALLKAVAEIQKNQAPNNKKLKFQISSLMLVDCWSYLISDPYLSEKLHLVTGTITEEGTRVLSRIENVKFEKQNPAYVSADSLDAHKRIISLDEDYGHQILGMFHSHMSNGEAATFPSRTDLNFMERMQKLGCNCLGGIFSIDGFVRFFSKEDFEIDIYGKGVEKIHDKPFEKIFKITTKKTRHEN